jgi:hypothetical protein
MMEDVRVVLCGGVVRLSEGTSYVTAGEPSLLYYPGGSGGAPFL